MVPVLRFFMIHEDCTDIQYDRGRDRTGVPSCSRPSCCCAPAPPIGALFTWLATAAQRARLETSLAEQRNASEDKLRLLDDAQTRLGDTFKALAASSLRSNNESFLQLASESLQKFQERARGDLDARTTAVASAGEADPGAARQGGREARAHRARAPHLLCRAQRTAARTDAGVLPQLRQETASLVKALRQPGVRGRWGEMQLKRVVEMAGMLEHCDFVQQPSGGIDEGAPATRRDRAAARRQADHHRCEGAAGRVSSKPPKRRTMRSATPISPPRAAGAPPHDRSSGARRTGKPSIPRRSSS